MTPKETYHFGMHIAEKARKAVGFDPTPFLWPHMGPLERSKLHSHAGLRERPSVADVCPTRVISQPTKEISRQGLVLEISRCARNNRGRATPLVPGNRMHNRRVLRRSAWHTPRDTPEIQKERSHAVHPYAIRLSGKAQYPEGGPRQFASNLPT